MRRSAILLLFTLFFGWLAAAIVAGEPGSEVDSSWDRDIVLTTMLQEWTAERSSSDPGYDTFGGNALGCGPCCEPSCDSGCDSCGGGCCPSWTVAADALFLKRSGAGDGGRRLTLNDAIDFDTDTGWRLTARRRLSSGCDFEFSYLGFDTVGSSPSWDDQGEPLTIDVWRPVYESDGTLSWVMETRDITTPAQRKYSSDLDSAEINLRRPLGDCTQLLAGFRWLQLDENLVDRDVNSVYHGIGTKNDLWGFQLGTESLLLEQCNGCLEWHAGLKAGIYYNHTARRITAPYSFSHGSDNDTAFCGELTVTGTYRLTDDLGVRFGYQMLWLSGVALASEQPPITDPYAPFPVDADGDLFYHGALVGLEYRH